MVVKEVVLGLQMLVGGLGCRMGRLVGLPG